MVRTEHREDRWLFPFVQYSPVGGEGKLPLIIQLHGAGERGNGKEELIKVEKNGLSNCLQFADYACVIVMPQCPPDSFWVAKVESIIMFVEQLIKEYNVDENRIYLTGLSMGGYGTWFTAMARPDMFAAIAPVCGGGMAWNANVLNMPIWTFHGAEDDVVSPFHTDEMVEKLRILGKDVKYTRLDEVKHNSWDYAYNTKLIEWFLEKNKRNHSWRNKINETD